MQEPKFDFVVIPDDLPFSNVSTHLLSPGLCMLLSNVWRINGKSYSYLPPGLKLKLKENSIFRLRISAVLLIVFSRMNFINIMSFVLF
jgi:hypothetical protein